jgi:hypothetical protein
MPEHVKQELVLKDEILQRIFSIKTSKKSTAIVSRYEFHEMLLEADDNAQRALPTDAAPLPDTVAAPCGKSVKGVRPKQSPSTATPSKLRTTESPSKPPGGRGISNERTPPASSKSPGDRESPKREAPSVRTPPARSAKQAKTSPSLPPGQRQLNFASAASTKATSRKAASGARDTAEPPHKKHTRLSSESVGTHRTKVLEVATDVKAKSKRRSRAAATVPPAKAPEPEVIDLCDSD